MRLSHRAAHCLFAWTLLMACLMPARADWTFHSFPLSNITVYDLAAREDTLYLYSSLTLGLYRSRDDGKTWDLLDRVMGDYYGLEADGQEVFFFGSSGILRSRDNGDSWHPADEGMEGEVSDIFSLGPILYAATSEGTYRSTDRGDTWSRVLRAMEPQFFSMTSVDGVLFASGITLNQDSSLFRSTDNGLSWKLAATPDTSLGFVSGVTGHGGYLYVTTDFAGLLRARPDGSEWKSLQVGGGSRVSRTWSEGARLYAYTKGGLFQSSDSGTTWIPQGQPGSRGDAYLSLVKGSRLFEQTGESDVNESRDNGASWTRLAIPQRQADRLEHLFSSGPNLIAYRRGGKAYLSQDLGRTWSAPVGNNFQAFTETGGRLFAAVGYGTYQYSDDHGAKWVGLPQPGGTTRLTAFVSAHDGWLYSGSDYIYRRPATTESLPWEALPVPRPAPLPPVAANYFARFIPAGPLAFAGSWDGRWQYSADSGTSWKPIDSILQAAELRDLAGGTVPGGGTAWLATTAQGVFRSPDGEGSWSKVDAGLDDSVFSLLRHGTAFFVGGAEGRIAYSTDQGATWESLDPIPGMDTVASMAIQEGRLAVIYPLKGIWSAPLPEGLVAVKARPASPDAEAGLRLLSGVLKPGDAVGLALAEPAAIRLSLHALDGRRIAVLRTGRMGAGRHQVRLDPARLRGLSRGRYLLDLRAGNRHWSAGFYLDR